MKSLNGPSNSILLLSESFGMRQETIAAGLLMSCHENGLEFCWRDTDRPDPAQSRRKPFGLVVNGRPKLVGEVLERWGDGVPVVSLGTVNLPVDTITADVSGLTDQVIEHLLDEGAVSFIYVGPKSNPISLWRLRETEAALARRRSVFQFEAFPVERSDDFWGTSSRISRKFIALLRQLPGPIGIVACSDRIAVNCTECAAAAGLRVPHDVLVVGTGNHPVYSNMKVPLSSVSIDNVAMGRMAVRIIVEARRNGLGAPKRAHHTVRAELIVRESSQPRLTQDPQVARAMGYLHAHFDQRLSLAQLAREVGMSKTTLTDRFRRAIGEAPMRYLAQVRLERARTMLVETQLTVAEIAFSLGYRTPEYFTRTFRKCFGASPTRYRRAARNGAAQLRTAPPILKVRPAGGRAEPECGRPGPRLRSRAIHGGASSFELIRTAP